MRLRRWGGNIALLASAGCLIPDARLKNIFSIGFEMNYKDLEVWQIARELSIEIHKMTLSLPKFEMYEEGSQIRRSSKSIRSNIVEGYGRRRYKNEFIKFIVYAIASTDETIDHLETLFETKSLKDKTLFDSLLKKSNLLGKKLIKFQESVEKQHLSEK
jgi:four helix bundle protein